MSASAEPDTAPRRTRGRAAALGWTTSAYFGEGLPYSVLHQLATEYLTAIGAPAAQVAYTSWFHVPVTLKPVFSPLLDLVGTKRGWTIATQLLFGLVLGGLALWLGPAAPPSWATFWAVLIALSVVHALHDIACDGFYMTALDSRGQALYSGTRQAAYRAAMYVGGAALVLLAAPERELGPLGSAGVPHWSLAFGLAGALMILTGLVNALVLPRVDEPHATRAGGAREPFWATYRAFFAQPGVALVLAFALTYRLGDTMTSTMSPVLLRELGVTLEERGLLRSVSLTSTIGGSVVAGWLLARGGLERWIRPFTWVMAVPWYLAVAALKPPLWGIGLAIVLEQLSGSLAGTAATVFLMRRCRRSFSASHYAFFTALVSLGSTMSGGFSGHLYELVGRVPYFALTLVASAPALWLVTRIPLAAVDDAAQPRADASAGARAETRASA
jgi:PAT family beta-lactamase induction signal transducer AmpG